MQQKNEVSIFFDIFSAVNHIYGAGRGRPAGCLGFRVHTCGVKGDFLPCGGIEMQDERQRGMVGYPVGAPRMTKLAAQVVAQLVAREAPRRARQLNEDLLRQIIACVTGPVFNPLAALRADLRRARVAAALLVESYIPAVARRLGAEWESDRRSFAEVSLGTARLQGMLREVSASGSANDDGSVTALRCCCWCLRANITVLARWWRWRSCGGAACRSVCGSHRNRRNCARFLRSAALTPA